jgi:4'-phosphopantetheinyl transferase
MADGIWQWTSSPPLKAGNVHVWKAVVAGDCSDVDWIKPCLSADEMSRASRFHHARDRRRYITGRSQLRLLLGHYLERAPEAIRFHYNDFGKPFVADSAGLAFNVSHAGDLVLYAFARQTDMGVDIELIRDDFPVEDIAHHYFSPAEVAVLDGLPDRLKHRAFFDCWTRKEAFIKARGKGLSIPLDSFDVSLAPGEAARLLRIRDEAGQPSDWSLFDLRPAPGCAGALAIRGQNWRLSLWEFAASFTL